MVAAKLKKKKKIEKVSSLKNSFASSSCDEEKPLDNGSQKKIFEEILSMYDSGVSSVSILMNNVHEILDSSVSENMEIKDALKESLAKKLSLRKKDFDDIFDGIFLNTVQKEELKKKIDELLKEHSSAATFLKKHIIESKKVRSDNFLKMFEKIKIRQKEREEEVKSMIVYFQKKHKEMVVELRNLLSEDKAVRVRDLKNLRNKFQAERKERIKEIEKITGKWKKTGTNS